MSIRPDEPQSDESQRAALYARIPTTEREDFETHLEQLRDYAAERSFEIVEEYLDYASETGSARPRFRELMSAAYRREFDAVLTWSYDRFAHSAQTLLNALETFRVLKRIPDPLSVHGVPRYPTRSARSSLPFGTRTPGNASGIGFVSYREGIDTTTPEGEVMVSSMTSLAEFESRSISERIKARMERAKAQGKRVSKPPIDEEVQAQIRALYENDTSINQISKTLGVGYGTAWNYVQRFRDEDDESE